MSRERNEQIMRTYLEEVVANERLDLIPEIAGESMVDESAEASGRDELVAHVKGFHEVLTDHTITIRKIMATETEVMAWWTAEGTHVGDLLGVDPTGRRVAGHAFSFFSISDGRISRYRFFVMVDFEPPVYYDSTPADDVPSPVGASS